MFIKRALIVAVALTTSLAFVSCGGKKGSSETTEGQKIDTTKMETPTETTMSEEKGVEVGGAMMVPSKDIVDNAAGSKDHTTLVEFVKAAGLVETLKGTGPFTVFAPTNEAFAKVDAKTVATLKKPESKDMLGKVLTYHVVAGALKSSDLKDGQELTTVAGGKLTVVAKDGKVMLKDGQGKMSEVTIADVISSNGVTHVVNAVLMAK